MSIDVLKNQLQALTIGDLIDFNFPDNVLAIYKNYRNCITISGNYEDQSNYFSNQSLYLKNNKIKVVYDSDFWDSTIYKYAYFIDFITPVIMKDQTIVLLIECSERTIANEFIFYF